MLMKLNKYFISSIKRSNSILLKDYKKFYYSTKIFEKEDKDLIKEQQQQQQQHLQKDDLKNRKHSTALINDILNTPLEKQEKKGNLFLFDDLFSVLPSDAWRMTLNQNEIKEDINKDYCNNELTLRTMMDSYLELPLKFKDDMELLKEYENAWGEIKLGKIMEDMDKLAAGIGYKYCNEKVASSSLTIVTASVDRIQMLDKIDPDKNYRLAGHVSYVGYSSMEVFIKMEELKENNNDKNDTKDPNLPFISFNETPAILQAKFTMVARNKYTRKAAQLPPLLIQGDQQKKLFNQGLASKAKKMAAKPLALNRAPPTAEERLIVHELYLESLDLQEPNKTYDVNIKWMDSTKLQSVTVCQPQDRNVHNFIFGGYLMRLAYQLAWVTSYKFIGTVPTFLASDEILFRRSVPIGSILTLSSVIAYTPPKLNHLNNEITSNLKDYSNQSSFEVAVEATVTSPTNPKLTEHTNTFHFSFKTPDSIQFPVPKILPKSYEECMIYLDARRKRFY